MRFRPLPRRPLNRKKKTATYCRMANRVYVTCPLEQDPTKCPFAAECTGLRASNLRQKI